MNICYKVWYLRTVIPVQCTTNTRCCSLETQGKSNIWGWPCPLDYYFWFFGPVTQHLQGHQFCDRNNSGANFYHENCKNFAKMRQAHQGAVGLHKKILTREIFVLHFMLLRLSFRLWVWHRKPNLLNSLLYLFIFMYAVLFHNRKLKVSLWYNCSRSEEFNICGPHHKICIYIENGFFLQFFRTFYITVYTLVEKYVIIKYYVKIYTSLV